MKRKHIVVIAIIILIILVVVGYVLTKSPEITVPWKKPGELKAINIDKDKGLKQEQVTREHLQDLIDKLKTSIPAETELEE